MAEDVDPPLPPRETPRPAAEIDPDTDPDFPDIADVDLTDTELSYPSARTVTVLRSRLTGCRIDDGTDAALDAADATFIDADLTGRSVESLTRVVFTGCRLGGVDFGEARLRDVRFDGCVLDLASMRNCQLERVLFTGGRLDGLDLSSARLSDVAFADVPLVAVTLEGTRLVRVDLTAADVSGLMDVATIRGATINEVQAMELSVRLARAAGVEVARPV